MMLVEIDIEVGGLLRRCPVNELLVSKVLSSNSDLS